MLISVELRPTEIKDIILALELNISNLKLARNKTSSEEFRSMIDEVIYTRKIVMEKLEKILEAYTKVV